MSSIGAVCGFKFKHSEVLGFLVYLGNWVAAGEVGGCFRVSLFCPIAFRII